MGPMALGRTNGWFVGSQQARECADSLVRWVELAKLDGQAAWAYLKDALAKLRAWPK
jgi:hypothetical protein